MATRVCQAVELRLMRELGELDNLIEGVDLHFPDPNDILNFSVRINPSEGYYSGRTFEFSVKISHEYPYRPPKVRCQNKIYHPNINTEGAVCLNILRLDWKPVLDLRSVITGLVVLFLEPDPEDPLNKEAAEDLLGDPQRFSLNVRTSLGGGVVNGVKYDSVACSVHAQENRPQHR